MKRATTPRDRDHDEEPKHEGDVLGLSDAGPGVRIPVKGGRGGHPQGIEVGDRPTGVGDVTQKQGGVTGADLGGREGTDITPDSADDVDREK